MAAVPPLTGLHDIFYQILSYLSPDPKDGGPDFGFEETSESKSARNSLYCLARTHRSFTELALAEMWRSLPSQKPLEHLLRVIEIARVRRPRERNGRDLELCGTPATHGLGWIRFQKYASLVRKIIIDPRVRTGNDNGKLLQHTFWFELWSAWGDTIILPHLQGATVRSPGLNTSLCVDTGLLLLVNTSIRDFDVAFPQTSHKGLELLGEALTVCFLSMQNLEVLSIEVSNLELFLDIHSLHLLHPRLRRVKLHGSGSMELGTLYHLANLPYLSIKLHPQEPGSEPLSRLLAFPRLGTLSVTCGEPIIFDVLLPSLLAPQLHTFLVFETHAQSLDLSRTLPNLLHTLVTKCPSLAHFTWISKQKKGHSDKRRAGAPLIELIAPLLSHTALKRLAVSFWGPVVPYSPSDLCAMAQAWPRLETFHLGDQRDEDYGWAERYADLESLAVFARRCPRLCSLRLPAVQFDSSSVVAREWAREPPVPQLCLRELYVDRVVSSALEEDSEDCSREETGLFCALMEKVFRSATVSIRYGIK